MELKIYNIINNPVPQLNIFKKIQVEEEDFEDDNKIVEIMNKYIHMDKLNSEYVYALGLSYSLYPKGLLFVSKGKCDSCEVDMRDLATGLLLMGAEQFMCFHNHPGGQRKISESDRISTRNYQNIANLLGLNFLSHIMITQGYFDYCDIIESEDYIPFS